VNVEGDQLQMRRIPGQSTGRENPVADEDIDPATVELAVSEVEIRKRSDHSLGGIINPGDPESESRDWIADSLHWSICRELGIPCEEPELLDRPKLTRGAITTPGLLDRFEPYNRGRSRRHQMRPRNFFMAAELKPIGPEDQEYLTEGLTKDAFTPIAPFEEDPNRWPDLDWIHYQDPDRYLYHLADTYQAAYELAHVVRGCPDGVRYTAVKTLRDTFERYMRQPETTMLGPDGRVCREDTVGLLFRRELEVSSISSTGKGMNAHEEQKIGLRPTEAERINTYAHPDQVEEQIRLVRLALEVLGDTNQAIARRTGLSTSTIERFRERAGVWARTAEQAGAQQTEKTVWVAFSERGEECGHHHRWATAAWQCERRMERHYRRMYAGRPGHAKREVWDTKQVQVLAQRGRLDKTARTTLETLTGHVRRRAYDALPSRGLDLDELKRMSTNALLRTLVAHGERTCALPDCDQPARPRSEYCKRCADAIRQSRHRQRNKESDLR
jgi:hypothetical protein